MPKAVITVTDNDDGTITVKMRFKPAVDPAETLTSAQAAALRMMELFQDDQSREANGK